MLKEYIMIYIKLWRHAQRVFSPFTISCWSMECAAMCIECILYMLWHSQHIWMGVRARSLARLCVCVNAANSGVQDSWGNLCHAKANEMKPSVIWGTDETSVYRRIRFGPHFYTFTRIHGVSYIFHARSNGIFKYPFKNSTSHISTRISHRKQPIYCTLWTKCVTILKKSHAKHGRRCWFFINNFMSRLFQSI